VHGAAEGRKKKKKKAIIAAWRKFHSQKKKRKKREIGMVSAVSGRGKEKKSPSSAAPCPFCNREDKNAVNWRRGKNVPWVWARTLREKGGGSFSRHLHAQFWGEVSWGEKSFPASHPCHHVLEKGRARDMVYLYRIFRKKKPSWPHLVLSILLAFGKEGRGKKIDPVALPPSRVTLQSGQSLFFLLGGRKRKKRGNFAYNFCGLIVSAGALNVLEKSE